MHVYAHADRVYVLRLTVRSDGNLERSIHAHLPLRPSAWLTTTSLPARRRAKSEQMSAIKAMQARHQKGLLTHAEQVKLAEEMARLDTSDGTHPANSKDKKGDCVIS